MKRRLALAALPLLVGGCLPLPITIASTAFSGISYVSSGKSTTDHMLSATMEQDCALTRPVFGEPFCRDVGPNGEGRTVAVAVAAYPGDRDGGAAGEGGWAAGDDDAPQVSSLGSDARQVAAAPRYLVAPPRVSIAGIIVTKDQLVPAPGAKVLPAAADASWAALAPSKAIAAASTAMPPAITARAPAAPASAAAPASTAPAPDGDRWVILGSFLEVERAQVMVARYAGRTPQILHADVRGGQWHRVALGPMSADQARVVRDGLGKIDGRQPWVVRVDTR